MQLVTEKLKNEEAAKRERSVELEQIRQTVIGNVSNLNRDLDAAENSYKEKNNALISEVTRLTEAIKESSIAAEQLRIERESLAETAERLARRDFAGDSLLRLAETEASIAGISYDAKRHDSVKLELKEMEGFDNLQRGLEEARRLLPEEQSRVSKAKINLDDIRNRQELDRASRDSLLKRLEALPQLEIDLATAEEEQHDLNERYKDAQQRVGSLSQRLNYLEELTGKLKERQRALAQASHRQGLYDELTLVFGKKGIQAMLIETTLPEIEDEANRLLARMTDGRMTVTFETQRDTKKGDVSETLDIKIADELGTRNYEMFSGGEAFRIDCAIRISLSRLLARRAGAPLPTLIIDEGFGTQDVEGIEKLKEAINSIQDEFKKIIVITHIEELKDAFPTRINVVKTGDGSRIEVNGG
jgi:exonuclease SbcC